jgi:hypothetical protein
MRYAAATDAEVQLAQFPHNLFVSGLFLFDLLMTPAMLALKIGMIGLLVPLACSGTLIAYIFLRGKKTTTWFVDAHWKLAFARAQWLLIGYAISAVLIFLAWLLSLSTNDPNMGHIIWTALTRIALMPTLILVLVTAVLEASAIPLAAKREVPDKLAASSPPPDKL